MTFRLELLWPYQSLGFGLAAVESKFSFVLEIHFLLLNLGLFLGGGGFVNS